MGKVLSPETRTFVNMVRNRAAEEGVTVWFVKEKRILFQDTWVNGYFVTNDNLDKTLAVAVQKPEREWVGVLAHEFSHWCQASQELPLWQECQPIFALFDEYLLGKSSLSQQENEAVIDKILSLELDCEKRAMEWVREYQLPIPLNEYIQKANSYLFFYEYLKRNPKWYGQDSAPFEIPELWQKMPTSFQESYAQEEYLKLYSQFY